MGLVSEQLARFTKVSVEALGLLDDLALVIRSFARTSIYPFSQMQQLFGDKARANERAAAVHVEMLSYLPRTAILPKQMPSHPAPQFVCPRR
jgi:hypothetical protein